MISTINKKTNIDSKQQHKDATVEKTTAIMIIHVIIQSSRFAWPKDRVCFVVISGTFHAISMIPTGSKAECFSEHGWRWKDIKKETNMSMHTCERYDQTATRRKGWSIVPSQIFKKATFHLLEFEFCVLMHVLKELSLPQLNVLT